MKSQKQLVKAARRLALNFLNENRKKDGKPLLTKLENTWWKMYQNDWILKAKLQDTKF